MVNPVEMTCVKSAQEQDILNVQFEPKKMQNVMHSLPW